MVNSSDLKSIEVKYNTVNIPAPYSYSYILKIGIPDDKNVVNELYVEYELKYTDREDLDDEDILDEGFSRNDDFSWQGTIPAIWHQELRNLLNKSTWPQKKVASNSGDTSRFTIKLEDTQGEEYENTPANKDSWEYFLQEMIQGIYEISNKEMPLEVKYSEIDDAKKMTSLFIQPFFSSRTVKIKVEKEKEIIKQQQIDWKELKPILKTVYFPDYDYEHAMEKIPNKTGKYIDNGEGVWYEFGIGVRNPNSKVDSLARLEHSLKDLISV